MPVKTFEAVPLPAITGDPQAHRAMIEFTGIDLAGPSYEGRVFLNNPEAGPDTPLTLEQGYAGSFHVYGYGQMADERPEETPAETQPRQPARRARLPIRRQIIASEAVRRAAAAGPATTVTLVAVPPGVSDGAEEAAAGELTVGGVAIHTEGAAPGSAP